jgi:O-antigen/teichoic acid export membrane protein
MDGYRSNHLARNSAWVILGTGLNGVLGLVFWAEATHSYPTSAIGEASAAIAAMTFASTVAMMGLGTTAVQVLPRADDETWSTAVNALVVGGAALGVVVGVVTAAVLPHVSVNLTITRQPGTAACIALGVAALTVATLLDYVFTAERATHYLVIRGVTFGGLKLALLVVLVQLGIHSAPWLILAWVVGSLLTTAGTLIWQVNRLGRTHRYGVRGVVRYIRKWFKILILHHMTALGGVMIPSLMPVLVVARLSKDDSAYFYVAWLVSSILLTVSSAVAGNLLAELSYGDEQMATKLRRATRLITILLLPPVVVIATFGRQILGIFGATYALHSYGLLLLFVIVAIPDAVTNVYVTVLRVRGLPQRAAAMNLAMAVVALAGGWWLMGLFGVAGAAWAWALAQAVGCFYVAGDVYLTRRSPPPSVEGNQSGVAEDLARHGDGGTREQTQ